MIDFIFDRIWRKILKSRFLQGFLGTFFTVLFMGHPIFALSPSQVEIRGVWLTTNDTHTLLDQPKLEEAIAQLSRLNFNTIYPVVWNSGYALYPSTIAEKEGIQPFVHKGFQGQDPLTDLITKAHDQGLLVLPWFEFGFMAPPSSELATKHPQWLTQKRDGSQTTISAAGEVVWLNPFHPEVQKFITSLVMEVMDLYDVDGIQFDDHLSLPSELGYDQYTINLYQQEMEKAPPANPRDEAWLKWRADQLTAYVSQLNQAIKAKKRNAIFSVSPNPYSTAYRGHLQDWLTWVRQDIINELVVQVYRPSLESFVKQLKQPELQEARRKIPTGVGILTGLRNRQIDMKFIREKVLAAQEYGLGVSFFFYDSLWNYAPESVKQRQEQFLALFRDSAPRKLENLPIPSLPPPPTLENTPQIEELKPNEPQEYDSFDPYNQNPSMIEDNLPRQPQRNNNIITPVEINNPHPQQEIIIPVETTIPINQQQEIIIPVETSTPYQTLENPPPIDNNESSEPSQIVPFDEDFTPYQPPEDMPLVEEFKPYNPQR